MTRPVPPEIPKVEIEGITQNCKAYVGVASGLQTFNGVPVLLVASSATRLIDAMKELNPAFTPNVALFERVCLISEQFVNKADEL